MYSLGIILSAFFGILLYFIAQKRGLNKIFWMIMGFIFGIFAVPFVFLVKSPPAQQSRRKPDSMDGYYSARNLSGGGEEPDESKDHKSSSSEG
jgi:hypothetical protein